MPTQKPPKDRASQFLQEAYGLETHEDMQLFYSNWADEYDTQLEDGLDYVAAGKTAALLMRYVESRSASILDIGCGTGLTSVDLAGAGYNTIDGLDFSAAMLEKARERQFYRDLFEADLNQPLTLADESYDAAVSSGTFTHGHVGSEPLDEIFRIIRPGGFFVCTIHADIYQSHGFDVKLESLNRSGLVETVDVVRDVYFDGSAPDGMYHVLRKR